jgi:site-specific DNA-methyltransferase (adenine-specific)
LEIFQEYCCRGGNSTKDKIFHPAIMPDKLAEDLIISFSNKGDLVYDPLSGYGTTCKAALKLDRLYLGSEISKEYYKKSLERI